MLRQLERSHDHVIGFSLGDELTEEEVGRALSRLRDAIAQHGRIRVLFRLTDMSLGAFLTALDERLRFVREHTDDIERLAVVSDDKASELLSKVGAGLGAVDTQHFASDEEDTAWAWLE